MKKNKAELERILNEVQRIIQVVPTHDYYRYEIQVLEAILQALISYEPSGGGGITIDTELSHESTNPVQNKVITGALDGYIDAAKIGAVNGVAGLDSEGIVPSSQLPPIPAAQVQSDWTQTDTEAVDYIKNKPNIPAGVVVDSALSTSSENPVQNKIITNKIASVEVARVATVTMTSGETYSACIGRLIVAGYSESIKAGAYIKVNELILRLNKIETDNNTSILTFTGEDDTEYPAIPTLHTIKARWAVSNVNAEYKTISTPTYTNLSNSVTDEAVVMELYN